MICLVKTGIIENFPMSVELLPGKCPDHLGIIADGNRRWARANGMEPFEGHIAGFEAVKEIGRKSRELGIQAYSAWGWSTENWNRTPEETTFLLEEMYPIWIRSNIAEAKADRIRIVHEGLKRGSKEVRSLPSVLIEAIEEAEEETQDFEDFYFIVGINHGGRHDILEAVDNLTYTVNSLEEFRAKLSEKTLSDAFAIAKKVPAELLNPDVIIRTGGNPRHSGYKLWQAHYTELLIIPTPLPAFTPDELVETLNEQYRPEDRRFGGDSGNKRELML